MEKYENASPERKTICWRGICERCPRCGEGKIFASYLKPNDKCSVCCEDFTRFRADDGPAWLTILLTGHLVVPIAIYFSMHDVLPEWMALTVVLLLTIAVALFVLPRTKGLFISVLWLLSRKRAEIKKPVVP